VKRLSLLFFSLSLLALAACKDDKAPTAADGKQGQPAATATATESKSIIDINGDKIYEADLQIAQQSLPQNMQGALASPEGRRALADEMIRMKLLEQEARKQNLQNQPEVQRQLKMAESNILAQAALDKLVTPPADADLQKTYETEKKNFEVSQLRQIVISYQGGMIPPRDGTADSDADARARAQAIADRARKGGNFVSLVKSESDDVEGARNGGALLFRPGSAPPEVEQVIVAMKKGEVSNPVKSRFGYHVFQLVDRQTRPFEEVKGYIAQQSRRQKLDQLLNDMKAKSKIVFDEQYFGKTTPAAPATTTAPQTK
jgi:peptidyl-prolyl cis-trans isomerase C